MPNFIFIDTLSSGRGTEKVSIDVSKLTKEQAQKFANMMRDEFLEHWRKRVEERKTIY
jgi:capsular polysaccharide biosynthesis protein